MTIAIDHDGTISAHPRQFLLLMQSLMAHHRVIVLTAGAGEKPKADRPAEMTRRLLSRGFKVGIHYSEVACVEGNEKGDWCGRNGADIFIDDEPGYLKDVAEKSPRTMLLKCHDRRFVLPGVPA